MQIISQVKKYWEALKSWLIKENNLFIEKNCVLYNGSKDMNMMMMMMVMMMRRIAKIN